MTDDTRYPAIFPEPWASAWGEDEYGLWMAFTYNGVRQAFRWIVPDWFWMGSPEDEPGRFGNEIRHKVILSQGFWLGETVVTQALWVTVMGENPSHFKGNERPVEMVSWDDIQTFIQRLNGERNDLGLRLPTEAEWEYACRAGIGTETVPGPPFWFGTNITPEQVNYNGNYPYTGGGKGRYRQETVNVQALPCNGWGLYQMHGNVWEWCADSFGEYTSGLVQDQTPPQQGGRRVLRGGSWLNYARVCRSAFRGRNGPVFRNHNFGFRLARGRTAGRAGG